MTVRSSLLSLGGISAVARALRHRNPSTVQGWWERETVPAHRQREVLALAKDLGIPMSADDLLPPIQCETDGQVGPADFYPEA